MSVMFKINNPKFKPKMLGLDYDWTLVNPKTEDTIPRDIDDWEWYTTNVKEVLNKYHKHDFMLVIFTNQSKKWKIDQIRKSLETLNMPFFVCIATTKEIYKPSNSIFLNFIKDGDFNPHH